MLKYVLNVIDCSLHVVSVAEHNLHYMLLVRALRERSTHFHIAAVASKSQQENRTTLCSKTEYDCFSNITFYILEHQWRRNNDQ